MIRKFPAVGWGGVGSGSSKAKDPSVSHGLLLHGVYGRKSPCNDCIDHGIDECNLWGDYYYLEGLIRLWKDWNSYW